MKNKSILLNGSFFQDEYKRKIEQLNELDIKTVYVFDHNVNPEKKDLSVYELLEAISYLNSNGRNFDILSNLLNFDLMLFVYFPRLAEETTFSVEELC